MNWRLFHFLKVEPPHSYVLLWLPSVRLDFLQALDQTFEGYKHSVLPHSKAHPEPSWLFSKESTSGRHANAPCDAPLEQLALSVTVNSKVLDGQAGYGEVRNTVVGIVQVGPKVNPEEASGIAIDRVGESIPNRCLHISGGVASFCSTECCSCPRIESLLSNAHSTVADSSISTSTRSLHPPASWSTSLESYEALIQMHYHRAYQQRAERTLMTDN